MVAAQAAICATPRCGSAIAASHLRRANLRIGMWVKPEQSKCEADEVHGALLESPVLYGQTHVQS